MTGNHSRQRSWTERIGLRLGRGLLVAAFCCAGLATVRAEPAELYDCVDDFSFTSNPSGTWTYGWMENLDAPFQAYRESIHDPNGVDLWTIEETKQPLLAALPLKMQDLDDSPPLLLLQTGRQGEYSVLRWTAPRDGWITVQALYAGLFDADVLDKTNPDKSRKLHVALPRPANPARLAVLKEKNLEDLIDRDLHVLFNGANVLDGTIPDLPVEAVTRVSVQPRSFLQARLTSIRKVPDFVDDQKWETEQLAARRRYIVRRGDTLDFAVGKAPNSAYLNELVGVHVAIQYQRYGAELWGYESLIFGQSAYLPLAYSRLGGGALGFPSWLGRALTQPNAAPLAAVSPVLSPPGGVIDGGETPIPPGTGPTPHAAPEPSSLALLGLGAGFLFGFTWRRDRRVRPRVEM